MASCSNCSGACEGCTGNCWGSCSGCSGSCSGSCSGCWGSCWGSCDGCTGCSSCSGTCSGSCTSCSGCSGSCTNTCKTACNATCTGNTQTTNINNLTLTDNLTANDISKIENAIKFEVVDRRGKTLTNTVVFSQGSIIDTEKIEKIITNLKQAGQTSTVPTKGSYILKALAEDLIAKIKAANNVTINLS